MFEYTIYNKKTNEQEVIFGYTVDDAFERCPIFDPKDWEVVFCEYAD